MNASIYHCYKEALTRSKNFHNLLMEGTTFVTKTEIVNAIEIVKAIDELTTAINIIETSFPDIKEYHEKQTKIQSSFTREQIDYICWQIGEWYIDWKTKIVSGCEEGQHRLGVAKEQLKTMICGD
jgi:hypothetical protein